MPLCLLFVWTRNFISSAFFGPPPTVFGIAARPPATPPLPPTHPRSRICIFFVASSSSSFKVDGVWKNVNRLLCNWVFRQPFWGRLLWPPTPTPPWDNNLPLWLALAHALDCCVSHFVTFICRLIWFRFPWVFPLWACLCPLPFSLLYLPYPCWSGGGEQEDRFAVKKEVKLSWVLGLGMGIRTGQGSASLILCRTISAICWIDPYRRGMWSSSSLGSNWWLTGENYY